MFTSQWSGPSIILFGDLVWPALVLEERFLSVVPIAAGLFFEWAILWLGGFGLSWRKAFLVDIVMNAVSTIIGIILIPLLGLVWEAFASLLYNPLHVGTFNYFSWAVTFAIAVLATTAIEAAVVRWGFKIEVDKRRFLALCGANSGSVAVTFVSLWLRPEKF